MEKGSTKFWNKEYLQRVILLFFDKLVLAGIIIAAGFYFNSKLESKKNEFKNDRIMMQNEFENKRNKIEEEFTIKQLKESHKLDSIQEVRNQVYQTEFESLNRHAEQLHKERMFDLEIQRSIQLEDIKNKNSINQYFTKMCVDKIAETWMHVDGIYSKSKVV